MNIRTTLAALAFCLASTVAFAATPTSHPSNPVSTAAPNAKSSVAMHCGKGHVLQDGKCVAKNKTKPKN